MSTSPTSEDLYKYIGMVFDEARNDPQLVEKFSRSEGVLKVITTEPDGCIIIDIPGLRALPGGPADEGDVTLTMSGDFANRFWQGDLNLLMAVTRGDIAIKGNMAILARTIPASKELYPSYIELLKNNGRTDLLAK